MGFPPELPSESNEGNNFNTTNENIINYAQNTSEDSDNDDNPYEGYEQIPFGDQESENDECENDETRSLESEINSNPNLPNIASVDVEIEQEVWNNPRPKELEIELDKSKSDQIIAAMTAITLPTSSIPEWARGVSDDKWKETLLERIRQRNEVLNGVSPENLN